MREVCACPFLKKTYKNQELYAQARFFITFNTISITGYQKMITRNTISILSFGSLFSGPVFFTAACGSICGPSVCLEYARCMRGVCATCKDPSWRPREASSPITKRIIQPNTNHSKDVQERSQTNYVFYHKYYAPSMRVNIKNTMRHCCLVASADKMTMRNSVGFFFVCATAARTIPLIDKRSGQ